MIAHEVDLPSPCMVPTSELGQQHGPGTIVGRWRNKVAVDFGGHLAHLTVARHVFLPVVAAIALQGCVLDKIDDPSQPSPAQQALVDRQAMIIPVVVAPTVAPVAPCVEVHRVTRCVDGVGEDWYK